MLFSGECRNVIRIAGKFVENNVRIFRLVRKKKKKKIQATYRVAALVLCLKKKTLLVPTRRFYFISARSGPYEIPPPSPD